MTKEAALAANLSAAAAFLERALAAEPSEIQRAAAIQGFEFCFELAWKLLKERLLFSARDSWRPPERCSDHSIAGQSIWAARDAPLSSISTLRATGAYSPAPSASR